MRHATLATAAGLVLLLPALACAGPVTIKISTSPGSNYLVFYVQPAGQPGDAKDFIELSNVSSNPPVIRETNNTGSSVTLSDAGYYISPTLIPLDDLNFSNDPPPAGYPGSKFTPLPGLDGPVAPGSSLSTPEPSTFALLLCGGAGLVAVRLRRRKAVAA